uniref:Outer membrane protein n=1 Tax=Solibacter usitatus (strain Ellin6076) TaxID=234267 RepID=Q01RY2_SOLUE
MHRTLICSFLMVGGLAMAQDASKAKDRSTAQTAGETNRMENMASDKTFVMNAAMGGMAEVEMGKLAEQKASDDRVKQFGQKMVNDHSKANEDLKSVASAQKIDMPASLDSKHQATIDRLNKLSGTAFDHAYVREMVKDHNEDVKEFQKEAQNGQDSAVRAFASKTLPTLQEHQRMILDISKSTSKGTSTSADRSKQ